MENENLKKPYSLSQNKKIIFFLFFLPLLIGMGVDLYVPSLPIIAHYFHVQSSLVQLTIGLYTLGYASGQIFLGVLSDNLGRKKILLISGLFYVVISFLSVFSPNIYSLILYRFLQGICIAGLGVVGRAIATDCFSGLALTKVFAYISTSWALGPIIGPFIGGYLQHYFNWQADFYFFGLYGLFIFIYIALLMPETNYYRQPICAAEIYHRIRSITKDTVFIYGSIFASLFYALLVIFNLIGPFLIQEVLKYSVVDYGYIALLIGFGYFTGNLMNRFVVNYIRPMKVVLIGSLGALVLSLFMVGLAGFIKMNLYIILAPALLIFFFSGFALPNMMAKCIGMFPKIAGTASAVFGTILAGGVFIMTIFASMLKTNTQMPLAVMYVFILLICLTLFIICHKSNANSTAKN